MFFPQAAFEAGRRKMLVSNVIDLVSQIIRRFSWFASNLIYPYVNAGYFPLEPLSLKRIPLPFRPISPVLIIDRYKNNKNDLVLEY